MNYKRTTELISIGKSANCLSIAEQDELSSIATELLDKVQVYEENFHAMRFMRHAVLNSAGLFAILDRLIAWSTSFNDANGERSDEEIESNIARAFENLRNPHQTK